MKNSNRVLTIVLAIAMLSTLLCTFALADVIFEPSDSFYNSHRERFVNVGRQFYANGKSGYLEVFEEPDGKSAGFAKNGEKLYVDFSYTDIAGVVWANFLYDFEGDYIVGNYENSGYARMADMLGVYDSTAFFEEFGKQIKEHDGASSDFSGKTDVVFWTFPRSGDYMVSYGEFEDGFVISKTYTDPDGLEWGYVSYYYGIRDRWVCISDLTSTDIAPYEYDSPVFREPNSETPPAPSGGIGIITIVLIFVFVVAGMTVLLIAVLRKRR